MAEYANTKAVRNCEVLTQLGGGSDTSSGCGNDGCIEYLSATIIFCHSIQVELMTLELCFSQFLPAKLSDLSYLYGNMVCVRVLNFSYNRYQ